MLANVSWTKKDFFIKMPLVHTQVSEKVAMKKSKHDCIWKEFCFD